MAGTISAADVYGWEGPSIQYASPISAAGPNQSYVAPMGSGPLTGISSSPGPAISVLGIAIGFILLRVAIELSEQS